MGCDIYTLLLRTIRTYCLCFFLLSQGFLRLTLNISSTHVPRDSTQWRLTSVRKDGFVSVSCLLLAKINCWGSGSTAQEDANFLAGLEYAITM